VGVVLEDNVYHLQYLACFVRKSIHIESRYRMRDAPSVDPFGSDKVFVNEAACHSTVKQGLDRVGLGSVHCEDFYRQYKGRSMSIQHASGELFGQFPFPF